MESETHENNRLSGEGSEDGSHSSDSFDKRQLIGAERDEVDPLPEMEGLSISGEARPGKTIQACGFAVNGTVRCDFAWARFYEDGTSRHIPGETGVVHLVTADDVDSYLSVEVIPIGENEQLGDLVRIFANGKRKITCDNQMHEQIERVFFEGHGLFNVAMMDRRSNWENVKLGITRNGFKIEDEKSHTIVDRKFLASTEITIPRESATGFEVQNNNISFVLKADSSRMRDIVVLTMRSFIRRATLEPMKKKRGRCFFF